MDAAHEDVHHAQKLAFLSRSGGPISCLDSARGSTPLTMTDAQRIEIATASRAARDTSQ